MSRWYAHRGLLVILVVTPACDTLWGGDFGHDPDAAMARMHGIPELFASGELAVESVWEPGDGITHVRFMYAASSATCAETMMAKMCAETGSIRKTTGAKVEAWCHGTPTGPSVERCLDGRRLPSLVR